jgi:hypothetical protein
MLYAGVLCAFYMVVVAAVNRGVVKKNELVVECPGSQALATYFADFPSIVSLIFAT